MPRRWRCSNCRASSASPSEGEEITTNTGRFGPYVKYGAKYVSLKTDDPYTVTPERALEVIREKEIADANRLILDFPDAGIQVLNGRYGPTSRTRPATPRFRRTGIRRASRWPNVRACWPRLRCENGAARPPRARAREARTRVRPASPAAAAPAQPASEARHAASAKAAKAAPQRLAAKASKAAAKKRAPAQASAPAHASPQGAREEPQRKKPRSEVPQDQSPQAIGSCRTPKARRRLYQQRIPAR